MSDELETIAWSEVREAFVYYTVMCGEREPNMAAEASFWRFLGTSITAVGEVNGLWSNMLSLPPNIIRKIKMLNSPHKKSLFRAMQANQDV